jgi:hypothetical protein
MNGATNAKMERLCIWTGVPMYLLFAIGFTALARLMPPPSPDDSAELLAHTYHSNVIGIRIGLILVCLGAALLAPFYGAVCAQLKRIEGVHSPLTYAQLMLAACFILEFIFPLFILQGVVYRSDRPLPVISALSDTAWLMFVGVVSTGALQFVVIALLVLADRRDDPVFPRWYGYLNIWAALSFCIGNAIFFVKHGPLAWNGLLSWWTVIIAYGIWIVATQVMMLRAVTRQQAWAVDCGTSIERKLAQLQSELDSLRVGRV